MHALNLFPAITGLALLVTAAAAQTDSRPLPPPPAAREAPAAAPAAPAAGLAPATRPAAGRPDFSGKWRLDPRASDDPAQIGQPPSDRGGPGGPGGGRGGGRGGPGGGGGHDIDPNAGRMPGEGFDGSDRKQQEQVDAMGREMQRAYAELEIFHAGEEFDFTDGMQVSRALKIGGEPADVYTPHGVAKAVIAWEGETLVMTERDPRGDVRRTLQFTLSADRRLLTVRDIRRLPGKEGNRALTLVYRPAEPGDGPGAPPPGRPDGGPDRRPGDGPEGRPGGRG